MFAALFALALLPSAALGERHQFQLAGRVCFSQCVFPSHYHHHRAVCLPILVCSVNRALHCLADPSVLLRVQNVSNTIQWSYTTGDPTPVDIIITNSNNQTLNGEFSIARFVPVSQEVRLAQNSSIQRPNV